MKKIIIIFALAVLALSGCTFNDGGDMNRLLILTSESSFNEESMFDEFNASFEISQQEYVSPQNMAFLSYNINTFKGSLEEMEKVMGEWNFREDQYEFRDYYYNEAKPFFDNYILYIDESYSMIEAGGMTLDSFNTLIAKLQSESLTYFDKHIRFSEKVFQHKYYMDFLIVE